MNDLDLTSLVAGTCVYCHKPVTEADSWGPPVATLDAYPPKTTPVYHTECKQR